MNVVLPSQIHAYVFSNSVAYGQVASAASWYA